MTHQWNTTQCTVMRLPRYTPAQNIRLPGHKIATNTR